MTSRVTVKKRFSVDSNFQTPWHAVNSSGLGLTNLYLHSRSSRGFFKAFLPSPCLCQETKLSSEAADEVDKLREGGFRYAPYFVRLKKLWLTCQRYVAYTSDVGESLRPVLRPWQVNLTYGIAGSYIMGDTAYSGYKKYAAGYANDVVGATCAHTLVFQVVASLLLPAAIIHTAVHQVQNALENPATAEKLARRAPSVLRYGPSAVGLAIIPALPLVDHPVEMLIDKAFDCILPVWRVGEQHSTH